jgi:branched-chain amino acid transport system permease protein
MFLREKSYVVEPLGVLLLMAGLDMVLANGALLLFKSDFRAVTVPYGSAAIRLGFLTVPLTRLILLAISVSLAFGLTWLMNRTELGNNIRAVAQNREAAALCGVDVYRVFALTFGLGCAVTAFGGCAMLPFFFVDPNMGLPLAIKSFIIVVLGGLGSIPGALLGAFIIGVVESVGGQLVPATSASIFSLILFLFIVFFRPKGLMGILEV